MPKKHAMIRLICAAGLAALLVACSTEPMRGIQSAFKGIFESNRGEASLSTGVRQYEAGNYVEASRSLQRALDLGLAAADQVKAHKYLAFIHCVSGRAAQCRDEFRKALDIDPSMELSAAEAGHPNWGPVFRTVKAQR